MPHIINFYIECKDMSDQVKMERILNKNGYAFVDVTYNTEQFKTLEDVEIKFNQK